MSVEDDERTVEIAQAYLHDTQHWAPAYMPLSIFKKRMDARRRRNSALVRLRKREVFYPIPQPEKVRHSLCTVILRFLSEDRWTHISTLRKNVGRSRASMTPRLCELIEDDAIEQRGVGKEAEYRRLP